MGGLSPIAGDCLPVLQLTLVDKLVYYCKFAEVGPARSFPDAFIAALWFISGIDSRLGRAGMTRLQ